MSNMKRSAIAERNDNARRAPGTECMLVITRGVSELSREKQSVLIEAVEKYNGWDEGNDPYHEHDFGKIVYDGVDYFWKIDDYGQSYKEQGASHPIVLTVMRADEY